MTIWHKIEGVWVEVEKPYIKKSGVWRAAKQVYVKRSGDWDVAYEYDVTPSATPELSLQIIDNRYIKVGTRLPGSVDTDLKRIRVMVSREAMPTTQFGTGFVANVDNTFPHEPWSDWYYNGSNPSGAGDAKNHDASNEWDYKQYPVNPTDDTNLPGDKYYYFAAWSEDLNGNWSGGVFTRIFMPKGGTAAPKVIVKETVIKPKFAGSAELNGANYEEGEVVARETPQSNGFFFHGGLITNTVGEQGTPTIKRARIYLVRSDDSGQAAANVNLFWHEAPLPEDMPVTNANRNQITAIGTLNKGEGKWMEIPESYYSHFNSDIKGFGLAYGVQASDFIVVRDLATAPRCGEVEIVWEEAL